MLAKEEIKRGGSTPSTSILPVLEKGTLRRELPNRARVCARVCAGDKGDWYGKKG